MAAFMPEPHILLIVVQPVASGNPAAERGLARRRLALPCRQHAAHDDLVDFFRADPGALDRCADRSGAEVRRGETLELALEGAHGRASEANDDDWIGIHGIPLFLKVDDDAALDVACVHAGEDLVDVLERFGGNGCLHL